MGGKKILMLTGEFTEEYEIFVFQQGMEAVGHTVHVACPDKKAGEKIQTSLLDFEDHQTYSRGRPFRQHQQDLLRGGMHPHQQACKPWSAISTRPGSRSSLSATACRFLWR